MRYIELLCLFLSGGGLAGLAGEDASFPTPGATPITGTFSGTVDWAGVGVTVNGPLTLASSPTTLFSDGVVTVQTIPSSDKVTQLASIRSAIDALEKLLARVVGGG